MAHDRDETEKPGRDPNAGPRAILRVFEVLRSIAAHPAGRTFAQLRDDLILPKSSLHRFLRTLEHEGYLVSVGGAYMLGPESGRLAAQISRTMPVEEFPLTIRPIIERLARETGESVMVGELTEDALDVVYIMVVDCEAPLRFIVPLGARRPIYAVASGKAILAFKSPDFQKAYLDRADFKKLTETTTTRAQIGSIMEDIRRAAVHFDRDGSFVSASAVASPAFDKSGHVFCAVSIAGPTERITQQREQLEISVREAAKQVSRMLGYTGPYPPTV